MDAIKKKMQSLKSETDNALSRAEELDGEAKEATLRAEKYEETVSFCTLETFLYSKLHNALKKYLDLICGFN